MAPKKNLEADLAEVKTALADIQAKLTPCDAKLDALLALEAKLTPLLQIVEDFRQEKARNEQRDNRQDLLERRMHDMDQQARMNNVILTGLQLQPRGRPGATSASTDANGADMGANVTVENQVGEFLASKGISLDLNTVEICHPLPRRKNTDKPAILIRFVNRKHKIALMKQRKNLKGSAAYLNDHLCKYYADLAKHARLLRSRKQIHSTWTLNSRIFVKPLGPPDVTKPLEIKSMEDFENCGITHV
ncbi:uncharacterized protein LOC118600217 [Oryzias melastigma]|uniref:uncharacterized protein LOC118600217 n=1 Tax=Oryzias melastigma TaxID=30732 RepID=UPI00168CC29B|nr:uncharacterized protein LOC118600217 [Oryzias melastigma]